MSNDTPTDFTDETILQLGRAVRDYFVNLYPLAGLSPVDRLRGLIKHYGGQENAGHAIGVSSRTIRRWLTNRATPIRKRQQDADRAYLSIHLKLNGFIATNRFERRMAAAWSKGWTVRQLGELANTIMTRENKVPATLTLPVVPSFETGMVRMWAPRSTISDGDHREQWPFNTGNY